MIASKNYPDVSVKDYLEGELVSPIKHEYRNGQIYAMAGASNPHVLIGLNLATLLRNHLRGSGCLVFMSDTKVRFETINTFYYPDVAVSCDERDTTSIADFICYPSLIVEVLSPTTEAFDRGDKFADYRSLSTIKEYVLIGQQRMNVDCYRRDVEGRWVFSSYGDGDCLELARINFQCPISALYEDVPGLS